MDVIDLEPGQKAPDDSDRIVIIQLSSGKFQFSGVAWQGSVQAHCFDHRSFDTPDEARNAGMAWAQERRVSYLIVEHPEASGLRG